MDLKKDLKDSYDLLLKKKSLVIPRLLSVALPLLMVFLFLVLSGAYPLIHEYVIYSEEFEEQKSGYLMDLENINDSGYPAEFISFLAKDSEDSQYQDELFMYLDAKGYDWSRYGDLINMKNVMFLVVFVLITILGTIYLSSMSYAMINMGIHNKGLDRRSVISDANRMFGRFIWLHVIMIFLVILPILLFGLVIPAFFISNILGVLLIILFVIAYIVYLILLGLRLFFSLPIMYIEDKPAWQSVRQCFHMTKGRLGQVFLVAIILYGASFIMNSFVGNPMYTSSGEAMFATGLGVGILSLIVTAILLIVQAVLMVFFDTFIFYAYKDWRKG